MTIRCTDSSDRYRSDPARPLALSGLLGGRGRASRNLAGGRPPSTDFLFRHHADRATTDAVWPGRGRSGQFTAITLFRFGQVFLSGIKVFYFSKFTRKSVAGSRTTGRLHNVS